MSSDVVAVMDRVPASKSIITIDKAAERLGPKVLQALDEKFNGSLVEVRAPDERDLLF